MQRKLQTVIALFLVIFLAAPPITLAAELQRTTDGTTGPGARGIVEGMGAPFTKTYELPQPDLLNVDVFRNWDPTIADGVAVATGWQTGRVGGGVVAWDTGTGKRLWTWSPDGGEIGRPYISNGVVYISTKKRVVALGLRDGGIRWSSEPATYTRFDFSFPDDVDDRVVRYGNQIVASSYTGPFLHGYDIATGKPTWTHGYASYNGMVTDLASTPTHLFVQAADLPFQTLISSVDQTGGTLWTHEMPGIYDKQTLSPTAKTLFFIDGSGKLHALDASTGAVRWMKSFPEIPKYRVTTGEGMVFVPVPSKSSTGKPVLGLTALDEITGEVVWSLAEGITSQHPPIFAENLLWVHKDGRLTSIDPWTGAQFWQEAANTSLGANFHRLVPYAGSLYYFDLANGTLVRWAGSKAVTPASEPEWPVVMPSPRQPVSPGAPGNGVPLPTGDSVAERMVLPRVEYCGSNVAGAEITRTVRKVTISANQVTKDASGAETFCGWVALGGGLKVYGTVTVAPNGWQVSGLGQAYVRWNDRNLNLFSGPFDVDTLQGQVGPKGAVDRVMVGGLPLFVEKLELKDGGVNLVSGTLLLPKPISGKIPVDEITFRGGKVVSGKVTVPDFAVGWLPVSGVKLALGDQRWEGEGTLKLAEFLSVQGALGFQSGRLNRVGAGLGDLNEPIGGTGLFLQRVYLEVDGLNDPPVKVMAETDISGGPSLKGKTAIMAKDMSGKIEATGDWESKGKLQLAEVYTMAQANVGYTRAAGFHISGDFNLLDMFVGAGWLRVNRPAFYGAADGVLRVPRSIPLFGGKEIEGIHITFDDKQGTGAVRLGPLVSKCWVTWGQQFDCDSTLSHVFSRAGYRVPLLASTTALAQGGSTGAFTVPPDQQQVVVRLTWDQGDTDFRMMTPDGRWIAPADAPVTPTAPAAYFKHDGQREAFYVLTPAQAGEWKFDLTNPDRQAMYTLEVISTTLPPTLTAAVPVNNGKAGSPATVTWKTNSPAGSKVSLFYDQSGEGFAGTRIAAGLDAAAGSYAWDANALPSGSYAVYAVVETERHAPVYVYAGGRVVVENPRTPGAPRNFQAQPVTGALHLSWDEGVGPSPAGYRVHLLGADDISEAVPARTNFTWKGLPAGREYTVAVSAYTKEGLRGPMSAPVKLMLPVPQPPALQVNWPEGRVLSRSSLSLQGQVEAAASVQIFQNDELVAGDLSGDFSQAVRLGLGENVLKVVATKPNGDSLELVHTYMLDVTPPHLTVDQGVTREMKVEGATAVLRGTVEPDAVLTLNGARVAVDPDGRFAAAATLQPGANQVALVARDEAGNQATFHGVIHASGACGQRFPDMPGQNPACGAVEHLATMNVLSGYPDGTFHPAQGVTRAEFSKMLVASMGRKPNATGSLPFSDTTRHWATQQGYLQAALAMQAVGGFPDGSFRPDEPVTRAQLVKIVAAAAGMTAQGTAPYGDVTGQDWYAGWVAVAGKSRLIGADAASSVWTGAMFDGDRPAMRAEAAQVLYNLIQTIGR